MNAHQLADATGGSGARIGRGLHRRDVTSDDCRDEAGIHLLPADEHDVRRLDHGVRRFDHANQASRFDQSERFAGQFLRHVGALFYYAMRPRASTCR